MRFLAVTMLTLLSTAGSVLAMVSDQSLEEAGNQVGPAVPEPGAILLFAAGAALVGAAVRRRSS